MALEFTTRCQLVKDQKLVKSKSGLFKNNYLLSKRFSIIKLCCHQQQFFKIFETKV
jgi:hypothetical protein